LSRVMTRGIVREQLLGTRWSPLSSIAPQCFQRVRDRRTNTLQRPSQALRSSQTRVRHLRNLRSAQTTPHQHICFHTFHPSPTLSPLLHTYLVAKRLLTHSWLLTGPPALHRAARTHHQSPSGAWAAEFLMVLYQHYNTFISTASARSRAGSWRRLVVVSVCA